VKLDDSGAALLEQPLLPNAIVVAAASAVAVTAGAPFRISGACSVDSVPGIFSIPVFSDGSFGVPSVWLEPNFEYTTVENTLAAENGALLICGSARFTGMGLMPNRVILLEVDASGAVVRDTILGSTINTITICRQIVQWNYQRWIILEGRLDALPLPPARVPLG